MATLPTVPGIGRITAPSNIPPGIEVDPVTNAVKLTGFIVLLNIVLKLIFIVAGLFAFFNIVIAGFDFINAGGDPKKVATAWERIWQSVLGLLIIVSSFLIAAVIGLILFKNPTAILNPKL